LELQFYPRVACDFRLYRRAPPRLFLSISPLSTAPLLAYRRCRCLIRACVRILLLSSSIPSSPLSIHLVSLDFCSSLLAYLTWSNHSHVNVRKSASRFPPCSINKANQTLNQTPPRTMTVSSDTGSNLEAVEKMSNSSSPAAAAAGSAPAGEEAGMSHHRTHH